MSQPSTPPTASRPAACPSVRAELTPLGEQGLVRIYTGPSDARVLEGVLVMPAPEAAEVAARINADPDPSACKDREIDEAIRERDACHWLLDAFAYRVAPVEVIGEHTSANSPWHNALALLTPAADVDRLRAQVELLGSELQRQTPAGSIMLDRATFEQRVNARFDAAIRKIGTTSAEWWPAHVAALREQILALDVALDEDAAGAPALAEGNETHG
jgi:hypothetical protein